MKQGGETMRKASLRVLEFHKIIDMLEKHASSEPGKKLCRQLLPSSDYETVRLAQEETAAAAGRLLKKGNISFGSVKDVSLSLKRLELGASLNQTELLSVASLLENTARVRSFGVKEKEDAPDDCLDPAFRALMPCTALSSHIRRCLLSETEMSDNASPGLSSVRRAIHLAEERIRSSLNSFLNGSGRMYLQDSIITLRDGRYCVPVKAEYKNNVPGIIHDQSSSNATFFIEPAAIVRLNNEIRELLGKEQEEMEKVLAMLSAEVYEQSGTIISDYEIMVRLDFIFAKGALANEMSANKPVFNRRHVLRLKKARHPLIPKKDVVPITLWLGDDFDQLVITGPNTGGKTVTLKTAGLLTLMGQAGLHIPALDGSELSVFNDVFADIGDEQSIEQSLSTFSSHMKNVVEIVENADENALVLFDELGAGTDPTEGAALAISILSWLHGQGVRTIATTHYSELKFYAMNTSGVENASCEFDVETLRPTYRLLIGMPGKSNAFAISSRLGLPDHIIESARHELDENSLSFEDLLTKLEEERIGLEKEKESIEAIRKDLDETSTRLKSRDAGIRERREKLIAEANEEAARILKEAKEYADKTIREVQKLGRSGGGNIKELEKRRTALREKIGEHDSKSKTVKSSLRTPGKALKDVRPGDDVFVVSMNVRGVVCTRPDSRGNLFVQMGIMKTKVHISDLEAVPEEKPAAPKPAAASGAGNIRYSKSLQAVSEIRLLGKTVDQAVSELDKFIDDAALAHLPSVRIVHGKGTGALRSGVHEYLRSNPLVKSFHLAALGEGDTGVTIAEL